VCRGELRKVKKSESKSKNTVRNELARPGLTVNERLSAGKALRVKVPRTSHAKWAGASGRRDPIALLRASDRGKLPELLPIRYGRMCASPFAFYRGAAALMARDLAGTPVTHLRVQTCGDCHVANFGGFGSPERRLVFDINDFDETLPGPWEWDVKRLAASIVLAGRERGMREKHCGEAAGHAVESYRLHMREYAGMRAIDVWYSHLGASLLIDKATSAAAKNRWREVEERARMQTAEHLFPKMTAVVNGRRRFIDRPPLVYHPRETDKFEKDVRNIFHRYMLTLPEERRVILDRYRVVDVVQKVVGVGSVGTQCAAALMMAGERDPLFLQIKEAVPSALEAYAGKSRYKNHGERVVTGQRMLQATPDVFLGWTRDDHGRDYYVRQLRDMRMKVEIEEMSRGDWLEYVAVCAWTLARAHARTGDAARIAGYMGKSETFDRAIQEFAVAYADQTEKDYAALLKAVRAGKVKVEKKLN
jgi:uncharacterized protein (DUF2252 family)